MPQPAIDHLARVPTIVLDPKVTHTSRIARVHFTTAATGITAPGTVYRMDEIPLPLRPALKSPYATDEEIIRRIYQAVAAKPPLTPPGIQKVPGGNGHVVNGQSRAAVLSPGRAT
jgi:formylmethanofuran dehydrogenase subunit B